MYRCWGKMWKMWKMLENLENYYKYEYCLSYYEGKSAILIIWS